MFKYLFLAVVFIGVGVLLRDQAQDYMPKDRPQIIVIHEPALPLKPDATVQECTTSYRCGNVRRYYTGMQK